MFFEEFAFGFAGLFELSKFGDGDGMYFNSFKTTGKRMLPRAKLRSITVAIPDRNAFVAADCL
jgi:hypothetical protein